MKVYFIPNSGFRIFDINRAYGLTYLISIVYKKARMKFKENYYLIEANGETFEFKSDDLLRLINKEELSNALITSKKDIIEKKKRKIEERLTNRERIQEILKHYENFTVFNFKNNETLTASLEPTAIKGIRESQKRVILSPFKVSFDDWMLAVIGAMNAGIWKWRGKDLLDYFIFCPDGEIGVSIKNYKGTKEKVKGEFLNKTSELCEGVHLASKFYQKIMQEDLDNKFSHLLCFSLQSVAQQRKTNFYSMLPLSTFEKCKDKNNLNLIIWIDEFFTYLQKKKLENLSLDLTHFILDLTFESYSKFIRTLMRESINDKELLSTVGDYEDFSEVIEDLIEIQEGIMSEKLYNLYKNNVIKEFGDALRNAIKGEDYSSLTEIDYAETPEDLAEAIKKLLRRHIEEYVPSEESITEIWGLVEKYGVKAVKTAIISHALSFKGRKK